jgi:hypothetical protein
VRILASAGQSTVEAEQLLESMGEELEALQWKLRRDDRPGTPAAAVRRWPK